MSSTIETTYTQIRKGSIAAQRQVAPGVVLDVDEQDRVLGIETIGDMPWEGALLAIVRAVQIPADVWP